ncbi:MAG: sialidase family protein [Armatimonadota bacterium]
MAAALDYEIRLDVICEGYDRETEWFQPRVGIIPPTTAVLTMTRARLWGSDIFTAVQELRSDDLGHTWSGPVVHRSLDRRALPDGTEVCPCDLTPAWHAATGTLLMTGHTATYYGGERGGLIVDNSHPRDIVYSTYDADAQRWSEWRILEPPDRDCFFWVSAGCAQRVDLPDGDVLLPVSRMSREAVGDNFWRGCFAATVVRCGFDGTILRWIEHGDELSVPEPRGLYEPSLTRFGERYYLTLRNDLRGYVAAGDDGLHFARAVPWRFDDGAELGSYNTQQHWVTHSEGLFLTYTRRGASNDHVIRHRAPLFIARVDPERLVVLRESERVLVPEKGAQLGNFGVADASRAESWVVTSEGMHGDAQDPMNVRLSEARGANNRVWLARLIWSRPNELVSW